MVQMRCDGGAAHATSRVMFTHPLATANDVARILGDVDPLVTARILAIAPSVDELDEAVRATEEEEGFGEEPRTPSSARVANLRAALADLTRTEFETRPSDDR